MATAHQGPILHQTYVECDGCENDIEVEWYCISCKSNLCGRCKTARLHRNHILKPWKDPEAVSARQDAPIPCKVHPDKTYVNYCTDCDVLCCSACHAGDHNGHHFKTIEDVVDEKRTALRNFVDELKDNCTSKAKEMKDKLAGNKGTFISRCRMNKEKIKQKIDSLKKDLTSTEDQLMKEEESIKNENVSKLEKDILEVKKTEDKIAETIKNIEQELSVSSNQSIIQRSLSSLSLENYKVRNISLLPTKEFETSDYKFPSATESIGLRITRAPERSSSRSSFGAPERSSSRSSFGAPERSSSRSSFGAPERSSSRSSFGQPRAVQASQHLSAKAVRPNDFTSESDSDDGED